MGIALSIKMVGLGLLVTAFSCSSPAPEAVSETPDPALPDSVAAEVPAFVKQYFPDLEARVVLIQGETAAIALDSVRSRIAGRWLPRFLQQWVTLNVASQTDTAALASDLGEADVVVVATPAAPVDLSFLGEALPFSWEDEGFRFLDKVYTGPRDLLIMGRAPRQFGQHGTYLLIANDAGLLLEYLSIVRSNGYHLFRDAKRVVTGGWLEEPPSWAIDTRRHRDYDDEIAFVEETPHFRFYVHKEAPAAAVLQTYIGETEKRYDRLADFLGASIADVPPVQYYLYQRFEDKGVFFGDFQTSYGFVIPDVKHVSFEQHEVHRALEGELDTDDWPRDVPLWTRAVLGKPATAFLETGLGLYFSEGWQRQGYAYWAARLYQARQIPPLAELLRDDPASFLSPFIVEALAGSFVAYLLEAWGKERFLEQYTQWTPGEGQQQTLERGWQAFLKDLAGRYQQAIDANRQAFPRPAAFQKGFNYAPNPGRDGYLTRSSDASLARLQGLGVNAVALVPYASMPSDAPGVLRPERRVNGEHDGAVVHAILDARRRGLTVMLKPQLSTNGWTGDIAMTSAADWDQFFLNYERWISHYALLAEFYGVEVLCVGTELVQATTQHEARWVALVEKLRTLYSGKLVYAANWGSEFETLTFWPHFDYIGLDNYYPLSDEDDPTDEVLRQAAEAVSRKIEAIALQYDRPVIFTEIGFPGTVAPWKIPYRRDGPPDAEGQGQARGYEAWFQTLHGKSWLAGIYWWKWFSYDPDENPSTDYVPQRKATERVIEQWYMRPWAD
ncbi:MAG: hypothetical protein V3R80_12620 [Candidatus Tectomicrobia bacterium]